MSKPEVYTFRGAEYLLLQSGRHTGHAEALTDVAGNLQRAHDTFVGQIRAIETAGGDPENWERAARHLAAVYGQMAEQTRTAAAESRGKSTAYLQQATALTQTKKPSILARARQALARLIPFGHGSTPDQIPPRC